MDNDDFNQIEDLKIQIATLNQEIQEIKSYLNKESSHRISFLTWSLANPVSLVIYPTLSIVFIQLVIINWGTSFENMSLKSLTNGINWILPLIIFVVGLYLSFTNKMYLIIQENADMNIFTRLEASINGQAKRFEIERERQARNQAKKDAEYKAEQAKKDAELKAEYKAAQDKKEAEYKVDKEKRDQEIRDLISELQNIKLSQAKIETKQDQQ